MSPPPPPPAGSAPDENPTRPGPAHPELRPRQPAESAASGGARAPSALVLVSGGLDSATTLALARAAGHTVLALTFRYGQTHVAELAAARRVAAQLDAREHLELELPLGSLGGSALVGDGEIPDAPAGEAAASGARAGAPPIPATYVPARNTVFLALALAVAEVRGLRDIFIGANAVDYSGYPDCRPEFLAAFERCANLGTRRGVESAARPDSPPWFAIRAPLVSWSKAQIIRRGLELGVDFALTVSCYRADGAGRACGRCDSCTLRRRGFSEAGVPDPTRYTARAGC